MKIALLFLVVMVLAGCGSPAPARLQLEITSPASRVETTDAELTVTGIVSDSAARVTINGTVTATGTDGAFSHTVSIPYGNSRIAIAAEKEGATTVNRTINVTRRLVLTVQSPGAVEETADSHVTVTGTVSDQAARVYVTGQEIDVIADGSFSTVVPLHYRETIIRVAAVLEGVDPVYTMLTITRAD